MRRICLFSALVVVVASFHGTPLGAQGPERSRARIPAWVAVGPDTMLRGERFVVRRGIGPGRADVLVVGSLADAGALSDAVRTLLTARTVDGNAVPNAQTLRMRRGSAGATPRTPLPWTAGVLNDARNAPVRELPGVGRVRAVQIWLPDTRRGVPSTPR